MKPGKERPNVMSKADSGINLANSAVPPNSITVMCKLIRLRLTGVK